MKIAIVHDWLVTNTGAERVLAQLLLMYPQADLFCVADFLPAKDRAFLLGRLPRTTFIQKLPFARKYFRYYLPFMPIAIEQFNLANFDLVISSSHAVAKGVITGPAQLHICYVHSPMRYAWDLQHQYLRESGFESGLISALVRISLHYLRLWDRSSSNGVDAFVANSAFISKRIRKNYRRDSTVIHPPVDIDRFSLCTKKEDFYVCVSRLVPYKRVPMIVEAFAAMPERRLVIIGDGPDMARIQKLATPNITVLGHAPTDQLVDYLQRARALVFAAEEDFGITPLEAQACGTPVIAYGRGGSLETVRGGVNSPTGLFFGEQTVASVQEAVLRFETQPHAFTPLACRQHAENFSAERFREQMGTFVEEQLAKAPSSGHTFSA